MKFYVASRLANAAAARSLILELEEEYKWTCTYDWTVHGSAVEMPSVKSGEKRFTDVAREISAKEMSGVSSARVLIVLLPGGRGTHVELGAAIATGAKIFVVYAKEEDLSAGGYPCVFYWHPRVTRLDLGIRHINGMADIIAKMASA